MKTLRDVDLWIIVGLMAVSARVIGGYLARFDLGALGYAQAIAADLATARLAWLARRYDGKRQRRAALAGVLFFVVVQVALSYGYYATAAASEWVGLRVTMAAFLPVGIGLLGWLMGQRDESAKFGKHAEPVVVVAQPEAPVVIAEPQRPTAQERRAQLATMAGAVNCAALARQWGVSPQQVRKDLAAVREGEK